MDDLFHIDTKQLKCKISATELSSRPRIKKSNVDFFWLIKAATVALSNTYLWIQEISNNILI